MADIVQELVIKVARRRVFDEVSTPAGLDRWWTKTSTGAPREGAEFTLDFGPEHVWRAVVSRCLPPSEFELRLTAAHPDWLQTLVGFRLQPRPDSVTLVSFHHTGWPEANENWRVSCYCWAAYLRLLRRYLEYGEVVPYEKRLDA